MRAAAAAFRQAARDILAARQIPWPAGFDSGCPPVLAGPAWLDRVSGRARVARRAAAEQDPHAAPASLAAPGVSSGAVCAPADPRGPLPRHVGLIIDGNRRWARQAGLASPSDGHRHGAAHIWDALSVVPGSRHQARHRAFICSAENLARRDDAEVAALMDIIEQVVVARIATPEPAWRVHIAGLVDMLPASTADALKQATEATRQCTTGAHVTLCVGYGGRQEISGGSPPAPAGAGRGRRHAGRAGRGGSGG